MPRATPTNVASVAVFVDSIGSADDRPPPPPAVRRVRHSRRAGEGNGYHGARADSRRPGRRHVDGGDLVRGDLRGSDVDRYTRTRCGCSAVHRQNNHRCGVGRADAARAVGADRRRCCGTGCVCSGSRRCRGGRRGRGRCRRGRCRRRGGGRVSGSLRGRSDTHCLRLLFGSGVLAVLRAGAGVGHQRCQSSRRTRPPRPRSSGLPWASLRSSLGRENIRSSSAVTIWLTSPYPASARSSSTS